MATDKTIKKADPADIVTCKVCSEAAGHEVHFDRALLVDQVIEGGMPWDRTQKKVQTCPKGHPMPESA
jgi:hypothetical protein